MKMAKRAYRTASGKMVDMDTLALKNETVLAVGNMNVNARGDRVGNGGQIIQTREELMTEHYSVREQTVPSEQELAKAPKDKTNRNAPIVDADPESAVVVEKDLSDDTEGVMEDTDQPVPTDSNEEWVEDTDGNFVKNTDIPKAPSTRGIADALADTKSVSVPFVESEKQKARKKKGINRI
jgi:hypothetical protein